MQRRRSSPRLFIFTADLRSGFPLNDCLPFLAAGFAVMTPTLRGENGNPGSFELFYGEVDDAEAAVRFLAAQPRIDSKRIYTFGHSVGGGISALLSLRPEIPVRKGGSSGGLYSRDGSSVEHNYTSSDPEMGVEGRQKNNGRETRASVPSVFSASLRWLCPSTKEEEEVIWQPQSKFPHGCRVARTIPKT